MADVKFMDLSQNDNPATTDSVLIGNSTNGLKRTTIGAIGNLFAVDGLFHFETVAAQTVPDPNTTAGSAKHMDITAPDVPGYTFKFWLSPVLLGNVYANYIGSPIDKATTIWVIIADNNTNAIAAKAIAVYIKSTVA